MNTAAQKRVVARLGGMRHLQALTNKVHAIVHTFCFSPSLFFLPLSDSQGFWRQAKRFKFDPISHVEFVLKLDPVKSESMKETFEQIHAQ